MLSYAQDALKCFHHVQSRWKQDKSYPHVKPTHGAKIQYIINEDTSPEVLLVDNKFIKKVTGTFLYYATAIGAPMLPVLETITMQQLILTENTIKQVKHFLDYAANHSATIITYRAFNMVLCRHLECRWTVNPRTV